MCARPAVDVVSVCDLGRPELQAHLEAALAIERAAHEELGDRYSHEIWGAAEFLRGIDGKWELSAGALLDGRLVGFLIASRDGEFGHIHRIAVHAATRRMGVARRLVAETERRIRHSGLGRVQLCVGVENQAALEFWSRLGYRRLSVEEHHDYAASRGLDSAGPAFAVAGHRYCVLEKEVVSRGGRGRAEDSRHRRAPG